MDREFSIDVLIKEKDMSRFFIRHNLSRFGGVFGILLSLAALVALLALWGRWDMQQRIILALLALMFTVFQPFMLWNKGRKQCRQDCFQKPFHYEFKEKEICVTQNDYKEVLSWEQVRKVVCAKDAIYVYMTAMSAFIIPREQCQEHFLELAAFIQEKSKSSH
ncbi:MAG: YcxB family protein [Lachnospiraceae bacterium]|nr:YcxB family protein [Lachnospiraceae bacterium]